MSKDPRELVAAAQGHVDKIKAELPPLPPAVFIACTHAIGYNDEFYWEDEGYDILGVFASEADAQKVADATVMHVEDYDINPDWDLADPEFTQNADGSVEWSIGFVREWPIQ